MTVSVSLPARGARATFACSVAGYGVVETAAADLPALRERPGGGSPRPIPPRLLRYADEQSVVALAAVLQALDAPALRDESLDEWGVLAAPQFLGRAVGAATFGRFRQNSLAAVSPHIIPQHSLHSVSGTISIALGMHGPNFGIGGGPEALVEGLTAALTFLQHGSLPGVWLVLTQWIPEPAPDAAGTVADDLVCSGVALALVPGDRHESALQFHEGPALPGFDPARPGQQLPLADLAAYLRNPSGHGPGGVWTCPMPWGGRVDLLLRQQRKLKAA